MVLIRITSKSVRRIPTCTVELQDLRGEGPAGSCRVSGRSPPGPVQPQASSTPVQGQLVLHGGLAPCEWAGLGGAFTRPHLFEQTLGLNLASSSGRIRKGVHLAKPSYSPYLRHQKIPKPPKAKSEETPIGIPVQITALFTAELNEVSKSESLKYRSKKVTFRFAILKRSGGNTPIGLSSTH